VTEENYAFYEAYKRAAHKIAADNKLWQEWLDDRDMWLWNKAMEEKVKEECLMTRTEKVLAYINQWEIWAGERWDTEPWSGEKLEEVWPDAFIYKNR
jgi:hypothetical protein